VQPAARVERVQYVAAEDRVIARETNNVNDELSRALIGINADGGRLTSLSQIDAD